MEDTEVTEDRGTHERVLARLSGLAFGVLTHAPTKTSEESAAVRGVALASGAKAILAATSTGQHVLVVMSAAVGLDWKKLKAVLGVKAQMASVDEVRRVTGCVPGAVPPLGSLFPLFAFICDKSLVEQGPTINFNAGLRTVSCVGLATDAYLLLEKPRIEDVSCPLKPPK